MTQWNHRVHSGVRAGAELWSPPSTACSLQPWPKLSGAFLLKPQTRRNDSVHLFHFAPKFCHGSWTCIWGVWSTSQKLAGRYCKCGLKPCTYSLLWSWLLRTSNSLRSRLIYKGWHCCRDRIRTVWWFVWGKCYLNSAFPVSLVFAVWFWWWVYRTRTWLIPYCQVSRCQPFLCSASMAGDCWGKFSLWE